MGIRGLFSKPFASYLHNKTKKWAMHPAQAQAKWFEHLLERAKYTAFGKDHAFSEIKNHSDFIKRVPIMDYEGLKPYVERIRKGELDVLWPGKPSYFAKTSGTTSGVKYIPVTKDSIPYHINSARDALMAYVHETGKGNFLDKKLIFLSGSPEMDEENGIMVGRLSGLVNHHVPTWIRSNQMPSYATNCLEDWEEKLEHIIDETLEVPMSLISGIPPWVQMYFDRIVERTSKPVGEVFPHFSVFVYGGVNFEPYRKKLYESIGRVVDSIETFPASEGFIAYQNRQNDPGLLMLLNHGIFFEFVPLEEIHNDQPTRLTIRNVELDKNYVLILSTNAGLWGYNLGDTVKFISKNPYKLVVTGRVKHFISAFGEHVIAKEVEEALRETMALHPEAEVVEFTVAPNVSPTDGELPHHEWFIEFAKEPTNLPAFETNLDKALVRQNIYYQDLIEGRILQPLYVKKIRKGGFQQYMKSLGKLGGQNKVPRLSNDRIIAEAMKDYCL